MVNDSYVIQQSGKHVSTARSQLCTSTKFFAAQQLDSTTTNLSSTQLIEFRYRQRDLLFGRQGAARDLWATTGDEWIHGSTVQTDMQCAEQQRP